VYVSIERRGLSATACLHSLHHQAPSHSDRRTHIKRLHTLTDTHISNAFTLWQTHISNAFTRWQTHTHWTPSHSDTHIIHTHTHRKTVQISFCQNFVIFLPILVIFGRKIAKRLTLCEVHLISISPNLHHYTTMLNTDVPNCYTMLKVVICNKLFSDLISTQ